MSTIRQLVPTSYRTQRLALRRRLLDLAIELEASIPAVSLWERGFRRPGPLVLRRWAEVLARWERMARKETRQARRVGWGG